MVYLVGAGPGDLGLVTFRARELIGRAQVLVYDYLVHPDLLIGCRDDCEQIYVGKKAGFHALPQEEIEALLVAKAKEGKMVVRLKGGDPFVFGRGGEEAKSLARDGIRFEVVPGVTAALAAGAYAGIPLTHRNTSSSLLLVTGHEDPRKHELQVNWRSFGALKNTTFAIYMGMGHMRHILSELVLGGMSPDTPAAAVQWASLGRQRSVAGTVTDLADLVEQKKMGAPAIIFVGEVVRNHETIDWFERLPLYGRRIAITRTREQGSVLRDKLEALGAEVIELPLIKVVKNVDLHVLADVFLELGLYDWVAFTSPNGVKYFFEEVDRIFDDVRNLGLLRFACVGEATAKEIRARRIKVECIPKIATAEALAEALEATGSMDSAKVLVVTGNKNRDTLVTKLEEARAIVDELPVYETLKADLAGDPVADDFRQHGADAILFCSSSAAEAYGAHSKTLQLAEGARRPLAGSIGPQTSASMKEFAIPVAFEAKEPGLDALVAALVEKLRR